MTFLTPLIAGIAAAIAIPSLIILYFLKLRRRDLEVSTTLLWKKAIQDLQANAPFQKLRRNILLVLQLLALCAALFALAQPEFRANTAVGKRSIILIDRSASMQSTDGNKDKPEARELRLKAAKEEAIKFVDSLREPGIFEERGDEAMVIVFDTSAGVRQNFTSDKALLKAAINAVEPTDAPSSIEQAFKLAKAYTGTQKFEDQVQENKGFVPAGPGAVIHLFSDGRLPDAEKVNTALEDTVVYHAIGGAETPNVGIFALQAERAFNDPGKLSIFIGLSSTAHEPRKVDVQMAVDEVVSKVSTVTVPAATARDAVTPMPRPVDGVPAPAPEDGKPAKAPANEWKPGVGGVVFTIDRVEGGVVTIKLLSDEDDALGTDDIGYLVFPPAKRLAVALVSEGSLFLLTALEGLDLSKLVTLKPDEYQRLLDAGKTGEFDVVIFDKWLPKVKPADGKGEAVPGLPPGQSIVMGATPASLGIVDDGEGERALIIDWKREHQALKNAALDLVDIIKSRKVHLLPDAPVEVIAQTQEGPAILESMDVRSHAIIVPFDPINTNWPLDPGYVLFLAGSLRHLTDVGQQGEMVRPGQTLSARLPQGAADVRLTLPSGERVELSPAADGSVAHGPVLQKGIYTLSWAGPATPTDELVDDGNRARRHVAANLLDQEESDIGTRATLAMAREVVESKESGSANMHRKLWPWLLLGALGVIMLEWFVYNKKVHI